jgi:hypothetical protein
VVELLLHVTIVLLAPVGLVGLALVVIEVRTARGGCRAHRRHAFVRASVRAVRAVGHSAGAGRGSDSAGMLLR